MVDQEDKMEFSDRQLAAHLARRAGFGAVSYTHLTLPTSDLV